MFGPNAKLDVPGSFHVSTAHELRFADGTRFSAMDKTGSGLTVAPPEAFGFLDRPPGHIAVDQSQLQLKPGKTFSLVGGDLTIDGGETGGIEVEDGKVHLVSAAGPSAMQIADAATAVGHQGDIRVSQRVPDGGSNLAVIDVSGSNGGGTIRIRGGQLNLDGAQIFADNYGSRASTGGVDLQADRFVMRNGIISSGIIGSGKAGRVAVTAREMELYDGGQIQSSTVGDGDAGQVTVQADRLFIAGNNTPYLAGIASAAYPGSTGRAGTVAVTARELELRGGGQIHSITSGRGNAGTVEVRADRLLVAGDGATGLTGITTSANPDSTGQAGTVAVTAGELELRGGGEISSGTFGPGNAGQVTVSADRLLAAGDGATNFTGIATSANPDSTGRAGTVAVTAGELELRNGGAIFSGTFGPGDAGQVTVETDRLLVAGDGATAFTGITSNTDAGSTGAGGAVTIQAGNILLQDQGKVTTQSDGPGLGGPLTITVRDMLRLDHAEIRTKTETANGGDLVLAVGRLFDLHNSTVTTSVAGGTGSGGNIFINPHLMNLPLMVLDNSRIEANAQGGRGGNIFIDTGQLISTPDSKITASGSVNGNITITAPNTDVSSSLTVLPETFLDVSSELSEACAARGGRPASSFAAGGRGGLSPDPGAPLAASPFGQPLEQQTATGSPTPSSRPTQAVKPITVSGIPHLVLGSPRLTCRG
jgi:large exoprotein involved in heme utilization and adhesion